MTKPTVAAFVVLAGSVALFFVLRAINSSIRPDVRPNENPAETARLGDQAAPFVSSAPSDPDGILSPPPFHPGVPSSPAPMAAAPFSLPAADGLEFTNLPPAMVLDNMRTAIRQYGSMFGGNPVGTNPEITSALNGRNPKQANFLNPEAGLRINDKGELTDPWGTPFFFHQLSGIEMEIRSAGPDKTMWTADDLRTK
jgi:hypothetical protein